MAQAGGKWGKTRTMQLTEPSTFDSDMALPPKHLQLPSSCRLPLYSSFGFSIPSSPLSVSASTIRVSTKSGSVRVSFSRRSIVRYNDHAGEDEESIDGEEEEEDWSFEEAVALFNQRDYYRSHDALEALWIRAEEPSRTLFHGILQCAVGFHHLFNSNHKGAMMELGEGVCKLRRMNFEDGPFHEFERDVSAVLEFVYQTQLELAACSEDMCVTMDQSDRSYQLLGGYAAGENIYSLETVVDFNNGMSETSAILFSPSSSSSEATRVKLPTLAATDKHLLAFTGDESF
ncbi:unnamed protein product [Thlaspi arvense]|uniref:DUF309 domain-containing protein n=1 Tax=Thlaspi arvense TaxID=13288 RepID=A0AAU9S4W2_THLAR|nr:unnamed protein product [Thlaspi arvense]